ncbi:D-alanyl-D-alanine carboxypeptidase [Dinoroseobacter shibae DFL 12 = DSM 16493]|uniref:D-alanyl-D-alanine carboxypeptidase n=1 Tax=Dinoroseobacter shibae (strain DSM 16493 / NCIMB 14021 / DFL 12) TaxID=398580 RepID=A8LQC9_DINSH|nr:D-alanyl-D-alanine carboxypeptidase [Dinoroseobacter shibae DFL 12 = DSM 16493]
MARPWLEGFRIIAIVCVCLGMQISAQPVQAAPYAAMVIDARTGEVLHSRNADTRLHPASLTKMMTLYIAFEAVRMGEIGLDTKVRISKKAAAEPPSKLGLRPGQQIALRYLIRASAVRSANDAATAIGEAISGSEAAFARRMNRTAKALGMNSTTFKNAHGLTESGHLSTARDMTTLGRHLFYDYPEYYNLFSRRSTDTTMGTVANTNRRLLNAYRGADGIKTGYTRAAGFNLVASAERGQERIIATVFGGRSSATRNQRVAELLDLGFQRAPSVASVRKPAPPRYDRAFAQATRTDLALAKSPRPAARPQPVATLVAETVAPQVDSAEELIAMLAPSVSDAVKTTTEQLAAEDGSAEVANAPEPEAGFAEIPVAQGAAAPVMPRPLPVPEPRRFADVDPDVQPEVVTRISTSGGRQWGIHIGSYTTRYQAERVLLKIALKETGTLDEALRKVARKGGMFDANFVGMSAESAELACKRLTAQNIPCAPMSPTS